MSGDSLPDVISELPKVHAEEQPDTHSEYDLETLHPSQLGNPCIRQTYLQKLGLKSIEENAGYVLRGNLYHEFYEEMLTSDVVAEQFDIDTDALEIEHEMERDFDDIRLVGRCDIIDTENDIIYDIKTRKGWYNFGPPEEEPEQRHLDQLHAYMALAGANKGKLIWVDVGSPDDIRTWPPEDAEENTFDFDPQRFVDLLNRARDIREALADGGVPTSPHEIPFEKCGCWYCESEELDLPDSDADIADSPLPRRAETNLSNASA